MQERSISALALRRLIMKKDKYAIFDALNPFFEIVCPRAAAIQKNWIYSLLSYRLDNSIRIEMLSSSVDIRYRYGSGYFLSGCLDQRACTLPDSIAIQPEDRRSDLRT